MAPDTKKNKSIEYPTKSGIRILTVDNATLGKKFGVSYRVDIPAKVSGKGRIRKQFDTLLKAKQWASKQRRGLTREGEDYFRLTPTERREVAVGIPRLRERGISVKEAIDFAVERLRPNGGEQLLSAVIEELQRSKQNRHDKGDLSFHSIRDFMSRSGRLKKDLGGELVHKVYVDEIKEWAMGIEGTNRTRMNHLRIAAEVFRFAEHKQYLKDNPFKYLSDNDRKEIHGQISRGSEVKSLSIEQAETLLSVTSAEFPDMLGVITLGLFCGIRTEELKQLTWEKVDFTRDIVTVGKDIAKKRRIRHVTLPENAKQWLSLVPNGKGTIAPVTMKRFDKRFSNLLARAGFIDEAGYSTWPRNGMRHSFGSYHYELHGDAILTTKELGHKASDDVLFNHYRDLVRKGDGSKYFSIIPEVGKNKIVQFP